MNQEKLKPIIEAALMAADAPQSLNQLLTLFEGDADKPERDGLRAVLEQLRQDYDGHGIELREVASGFRFQVRADYADWVNRLQPERPQRYSRAFLETLAIIAYRQPITRAEIEEIRGVSVSSNIIKSIQEREWIRVVGHRDVPGKPELLATTRQFLDYFNLRKLSDLPPLSEIKDFDNINPDLFEVLESQPVEQSTPQTGDDDNPARVEEAGEPAATDETGTGTEEYPQEEETSASDITEEETADDEAMSRDNVVPFSG